MAPEQIDTKRLLLRRPVTADAQEIFDTYASDPAVCKYLAWPMHETIADTFAFLEFSDALWNKGPAGPYLIFDRQGKTLLGSTGLEFEGDFVATTGYLIARDHWGNGYASEALAAMRDLAPNHGARQIYTHVHADHSPSQRVLEKAGFVCDGRIPAKFEFPNLEPGKLLDVISYSWRPGE